MRLVADPVPDRDLIHSAMRPGLGEDTLLRPRPSCNNDLAWVHPLVGDDSLEFVPVSNGSEQVGSNRRLVSVPDRLSDEDEAVAGIPQRRPQDCKRNGTAPPVADSDIATGIKQTGFPTGRRTGR